MNHSYHCLYVTLPPLGETLSSTTTVEQLGATPGQSIELQVHLPPLAEPEEQQAHSTADIAQELSIPNSESRHGLPSSIIVQVNSGK